MKRVVLLFLCTVVCCVTLFYLHLTVGASIYGPRTAVSEACNRVIAGMAASELASVIQQDTDIDLFFLENDPSAQISKVSGGWICFCKASLDADVKRTDHAKVTSVEPVFCSD